MGRCSLLVVVVCCLSSAVRYLLCVSLWLSLFIVGCSLCVDCWLLLFVACRMMFAAW